MLIAVLALLQGVQAPAPPRREIPDPGAIATDQRVTPAGVQSVFTDRVFGVRFGAKPGEVWVSIHGAAYRLGWRDNAVLGSAAFDGRAGVQGVAIDPVNGRTLVTSVGLLPADVALRRTPGSEELARTKSVAHLTAYEFHVRRTRRVRGRCAGRGTESQRHGSPRGRCAALGERLARRARRRIRHITEEDPARCAAGGRCDQRGWISRLRLEPRRPEADGEGSRGKAVLRSVRRVGARRPARQGRGGKRDARRSHRRHSDQGLQRRTPSHRHGVG